MVRNTSAIVLVDKKKKILLQHRAEDAPRLPGFWGFFGGGIEQGETPEQAVFRETREELNYPLKSPKLLTSVLTEDGSTLYVFTEDYDPTKPLILNEGQGMAWVTFEEASKLKMIQHDQGALRKIAPKILRT